MVALILALARQERRRPRNPSKWTVVVPAPRAPCRPTPRRRHGSAGRSRLGRATFYTTGMEHSPTSATGTAVGARAVARDAVGGVGGAEEGW